MGVNQFYPQNYFDSKRKISEQFIPPPKNLKHYTFGYNENISDSLWLRFIQNADECGKDKVKKEAFNKEFGVEETKNKSVSEDNQVNVSPTDNDVCVKGWAFHIINAISELSPKFKMAQKSGAVFLSIFAEDHLGAAIIFDKAIKNFPKEWNIYYYAAYHQMFEMKNFSKAAVFLEKAGELGAPWWVKSLASKLYSREGQYELGLSVLKKYQKKVTDEKRKKIISKRIKNLEFLLMQKKKNLEE